MSESVFADGSGVPLFAAGYASGASLRIKDIVWRTSLELARDEARKVRRPIVVKPLNQGGSGEYW